MIDHPELFPEMPKVRIQWTERELLVQDIADLKKATGATTRQIAEFWGVPVRTVEKWVMASNLPPEWCCRMLRNLLQGYQRQA